MRLALALRLFRVSVRSQSRMLESVPGPRELRGESARPAQATGWKLGVPRAVLPLPAQGAGLDWTCL